MDIEGTRNSVYMMKFGACIPFVGCPHLHKPTTFPKMKKWRRAAALEVVYGYVKEGKVSGPFPGSTRTCLVTGHPLYFYPSFVVPKTTAGTYRWVLNASYNIRGPSLNDRIFDFKTSFFGLRNLSFLA